MSNCPFPTILLTCALAAIGVAPPAHAQEPGAPQVKKAPATQPAGFGILAELAGPTQLLSLPEVLKEIGLKEEQRSPVLRFQRRQVGKMRQFFPSLVGVSADFRGKTLLAFVEEQEKDLEEVLEAKQVARLKQLQLQREGLRAVVRLEVAEALMLTPEQQDAARRAVDEERLTALRLAPRLAIANEETVAKAISEITTARKLAESTLDALLSAEQKGKLKALHGPAFSFEPAGTPAAASGGAPSPAK